VTPRAATDLAGITTICRSFLAVPTDLATSFSNGDPLAALKFLECPMPSKLL
jgi:hypothetical protein